MGFMKKMRKKKSRWENPLVAGFLLEEVRTTPGIKTHENIINQIFCFMLGVITVICVIYSAIGCFEPKFNTEALLAGLLIAQCLIFAAVYFYGNMGKIRYFSLVSVVYVAGVVFFRKQLMYGLLYVATRYIEIFNSYYNETLFVKKIMSGSEREMTTKFLLAFGIGLLILVDYIIICYMNRVIFLLVTFLWMILPLSVGIVPDTAPFIVYICIYMTVCSTVTVKKRRGNKYQKAFTDVTSGKMMITTVIFMAIVMGAVALTLPEDLYDEDYLYDRHIKYEENMVKRIDEAEEKYSIDFSWLDALVGADDIYLGHAGADDNITDTTDGRDLFERTMELYDYFENGLGDISKEFYEGFSHGMLNNFKGMANISKSKMYTLEIQKTDVQMSDLYIKTYQSDYYYNGRWLSVEGESDNSTKKLMDEQFCISQANLAMYVFPNEIYGDWNTVTSYPLRKVILTAQKGVKDTIYPLYLAQEEVSVDTKGGKTAYNFTVQNESNLENIHRPGELESISDFLAESYDLWYDPYIIVNYMLWYMYDSGFGTFYEMYTSVPDSCSVIKSDMESVAENLGINPQRELLSEEPESYINYYNDVVTAVNYVAEYLSEGYTYSLNPEMTSGKDQIVDFLYYSKKGYCMHFASAATMMLRSMGIPTRYVEGYAVSANDINERLDKLDEGDMGSVDIYGTNAHAWIEVYIKGIGWVPQEMTLGRSESGNSFYEEAERERITTAEPKPTNTNTSTHAPTEKPSGESKAPGNTDAPGNTNAPGTNAPDININSTDKRTNLKKFIPVGVAGIIIVVTFSGIMIFTGMRKKRSIALKTSKGIYKYVNQILTKAAAQMGVYCRNDMNYDEFAKAFSDVDKNMAYEDILKFMEIKRKVVFSREGLSVDDAECLRDIYNRYMEQTTKEWNRYKYLWNVKIKGMRIRL